MYLKDDMRQYPMEKIMGLVIMWIGLFVLTLMKGGQGVDSIVGITCESPMYAVLIAVQFLWMFGIALFYGLKLYHDQQKRIEVQYPFFEADPVWDIQSMKTYGLFTFLAGVGGGLIGSDPSRASDYRRPASSPKRQGRAGMRHGRPRRMALGSGFAAQFGPFFKFGSFDLSGWDVFFADRLDLHGKKPVCLA